MNKEKVYTNEELQEIGLQVWNYLRNNIGQDKYDLPKKLRNKIKDFPYECPLCYRYRNEQDFKHTTCSSKCPVYKNRKNCFHPQSLFGLYDKYNFFVDDPILYNKYKNKTEKYANKIFEAIMDWEWE